ncbi:MAG TPA: Ldh family oxidoreductase, partial [Bryobacteraceae bacterium]
MPTVAAPVLRSFSESILLAAGVPAHQAAIVAASLIAANLRGVDSHGIQLLTFYVDQLLAGEMDPHAEGRVTSESGSCLLFDGQNGIGQWIAETCCGHAIRIAG